MACAELGSPFTAALCDCVAQSGVPSGVVFDRLANWPDLEKYRDDAVPLRFAGALNRLVIDQLAPELAAQYPPHKMDEATFVLVVHHVVEAHGAFINDYMNSPPQTNEVARSAILLPAILQLANRHHLPFSLYELGASAGLNQNLSRFAYDYGSWRWGDENAGVKLSCEWRGAQPEQTSGEIDIISTRGCDIMPSPIATLADQNRLLSYVWPDQDMRIARLKAAIDTAKAHPPIVEKSGADDWLGRVLRPPTKGQHTLIMHTIMWQYMPADVQQTCAKHINACGAKATPDAPVSWLRFEADGKRPGGALQLTHWDGGNDHGKTILLARADYHGRWVDWSAQAL